MNAKPFPHFKSFIITALLAAGVLESSVALGADSLRNGFLKPEPSARPWVYWFIMDGNVSREGITADFEAMRRAGIGGMVMMEVDAGIPKGPVHFMSAEWQDLFAHAVREAERLGLQITLNAGPGWTGSGGPWVKPEQSMQHLVASATRVTGPRAFAEVLPLPKRRPAFFGDGQMPAEQEKAKDEFYRDELVLAFPSPSAEQRIQDLDEKALYVRAPYSSQPGVKAFLPTLAEYPRAAEGAAVDPKAVLNLTQRLGPGGRLNWDVPEGNWTILRFGRTSTGANTRPAPAPGVGLESDKFDRVALEAHFDAFVGTLLKKVEPRKRGAGWTSLHIDSWEMGAQNWTAGFHEQFRQRRGYDPAPYLAVLAGTIVGSVEISERFLWDLRVTAQELVIENHAQHLKALGARHNLGLSIEPYDMNPCSDLSLGAVADVPMCEFWLYGFDTAYSVIEAASIAHTLGKPIVAAEAFTSTDAERWQAYPGSMKGLGDWAFCAGVNRIVFHRYQHQPALDKWPGMTMGPYGVHWERTQTWWEMVPAYHTYLARCQYLLGRGRAVADVCFLSAEGAPHVFKAPPGALRGIPPDRSGYNFDALAPELLANMEVKDGRLCLPSGATYNVLVLPELPTMTPALLFKVRDLVAAGATVVGPPPKKSPSLSNYPECDRQVQSTAAALWGECDGEKVLDHRYERGRVVWHKSGPTRPGEPLAGAQWIWFPEGNPASQAPLGRRRLSREFQIGSASAIESAVLEITADNSFRVQINGKNAGEGDNFTRIYDFDVKTHLVAGTNSIIVLADNAGDLPNPAGLIAKLTILKREGETIEIVTDRNWLTAREETAPGEAHSPAMNALELGPLNTAPWSNRLNTAPPRQQYGDFGVVEHTLRTLGVEPDFESDKPLRYVHRIDGKTDLYFVANPTAAAISAECTFRVSGKSPELWDAVTGEIRTLGEYRLEDGRTVIPLQFAPYQSFFVLFRKAAGAPRKQTARLTESQLVMRVDGPWDVSFDPRWGGPAQVVFGSLTDWSRRPEEGIKFYSGTATYRKDIEMPSVMHRRKGRIYLDFGEVRNLANVKLNGQHLGVVWCAPWRIEITGAIQRGTNQIEIEVANLWPNRLIGDAALPEGKRLTATTWSPFKAGMPLLESGLLGPVTVWQEARE